MSEKGFSIKRKPSRNLVWLWYKLWFFIEFSSSLSTQWRNKFIVHSINPKSFYHNSSTWQLQKRIYFLKVSCIDKWQQFSSFCRWKRGKRRGRCWNICHTHFFSLIWSWYFQITKRRHSPCTSGWNIVCNTFARLNKNKRKTNILSLLNLAMTLIFQMTKWINFEQVRGLRIRAGIFLSMMKIEST